MENKMLKTLALCLVLQVTVLSLTVSAQRQPNNVTVKIIVKNELNKPTPNRVIYRCWSRTRDFGWRMSEITGSRHRFKVPVVGADDKVNHVCHFRSDLGTVNFLISQFKARRCANTSCVHAVTINGLEFRVTEYSKDKKPIIAKYQERPWSPTPGLDVRVPVMSQIAMDD